MSVRVPVSPIEVSPQPNGSNGAVPFGFSDNDGFALYAALDALGRSQGGNGARLVSWPFDPRLSSAADGPANMSTGRLMLRPQLVRGGLRIDGVAYILVTAGNFTPVNSNQIAAYTYDGTQMNRQAQCASDPTIWSGAVGFRIKAFNAAYTPPTDMLLWAAGLYNASAAVTVPQILMHQVQTTGAKNLGLITGGTAGDSMAVDGAAGGSANMPATIANATLDNTNTNLHWLAFYHLY